MTFPAPIDTFDEIDEKTHSDYTEDRSVIRVYTLKRALMVGQLLNHSSPVYYFSDRLYLYSTTNFTIPKGITPSHKLPLDSPAAFVPTKICLIS